MDFRKNLTNDECYRIAKERMERNRPKHQARARKVEASIKKIHDHYKQFGKENVYFGEPNCIVLKTPQLRFP